MTTLPPEAGDKLHALTWYMSARRTALRAALSFRAPLSVEAKDDMRVQYSAYFQNLLSATELLREAGLLPPKAFETALYARFVFPGFPDGESNYEYVKYMRNAIVHRGFDIAARAEIHGDLPMLIAEPSFQNNASNPTKIKTFMAFDRYILEIIRKCEAVIGPVALECLEQAGIFETVIDPQAAISDARQSIRDSDVMPDWAKAMAANVDFRPEWFEDLHNTMKDKVRAALAPCQVTVPT